jgi:uracil-DNA glycosylase
MTKEDNGIGRQILEHLKLYQDLGVRYVRAAGTDRTKPAARPERPPVPAAAPPKAPKKPAAVKPTAAPPQKPVPKSADPVPKPKPEPDQQRIDIPPPVTAGGVPGESLDSIRAEVENCRRCKLWPTRNNIVFASGNPNAELMFVGEAPGADEDEQGLPFVGRAGQLLTKVIESIGLNRNEVFICNILKCRPPGNRNPEPDEIAACEQFLFRQIAVVKPKIICAVGAYSAQTLLRTSELIGQLRGRLLDYRGTKLLATYHPAYLLRNPIEKRKVWEDMLVIRKYLDSIHARQR